MKWAFSIVVGLIMFVGFAVSATAGDLPLPAGPQEPSPPKSGVPDPPNHQAPLTLPDQARHSSGTLKVVSKPSGPDDAELQRPSVEIPQDTDDGGPGRWTAGGGFYYLKPFFQTNPAFSTTISPDVTLTTGSQTDFSWDYQF